MQIQRPHVLSAINANIDYHSPTSASAPEPSVQDDLSSSVNYVHQLADLNVRLFEHAEKLPPVSTVITDKIPSLDGRVFAIDETFRMTQTLIDILKRLYPHTFHTAPPADFVPDQGTVLLIMSCSNRVFDIYEIIFSHMRGCIMHRITPAGKDGKTILLPQLRTGSFASPTPSAIVPQMLPIILMASELFDQLQDVLGVWRWNGAEKVLASSKGDSSAGPVEASHGHFEELELTVGTRLRFPDFTEEAKAKMAERASAVAGKIVNTRQLLLRLPGMRGEGSIQQFLS